MSFVDTNLKYSSNRFTDNIYGRYQLPSCTKSKEAIISIILDLDYIFLLPISYISSTSIYRWGLFRSWISTLGKSLNSVVVRLTTFATAQPNGSNFNDTSCNVHKMRMISSSIYPDIEFPYLFIRIYSGSKNVYDDIMRARRLECFTFLS